MSAKQPSLKTAKPEPSPVRPPASLVEEAPLTLPAAELHGPQHGLPPDHPTAQRLRQATVLQMQRQFGNAYVQRVLARQGQVSPPPGGDAEPVSSDESEGGGAVAERPLASPGVPADGNGPGQPGGNGRGPRHLSIQRQEEGEGDEPTEAEKQAALAAAAAAEASANQAAAEGREKTAKSKAEKAKEQEAGQAARQEAGQKSAGARAKAGEAAGKPGGPEAGKPVGPGGAAAGKAAKGMGAPAAANGAGPGVNGTGAEDKAPASPEEDPAYQAAVGRIEGVGEKEKSHDPAAKKAGEAQDAAESPGSELEARAQDKQVGKMEQAETPGFDAAGFKAQLMQRIQALAPKTAQEADNFKESDKVGSLKEEMKGKAGEEQEKSQAPMEEASAEAPDTGAVAPKPVKPLVPLEPGEAPPDVNGAAAVPKKKTPAEVEAPLKAEGEKPDEKMAEADITEEQLANSNEPEFQSALQAKKEAKEHSAEAPQEYRQAEEQQLTTAEGEAAQTSQQQLQGMHGDRSQLLQQVAQQQGQTKSEDERERERVAGDIQKIYEKTKASVEKILADLDGKVDQAFDAGAAEAKKAFEDFVEAKMEAYKERRYGGWFGWARWVKDKVAGMPGEVNVFYQQGRDLYLGKMDAVIDNVVAIIGRTLAEAKKEIAKGKQEIQDYLTKLPENLRQVGQQAAEGIQGKFSELEQSVDNKQNELIDRLAQKYQENLQAVDARIEELKAANRGLVDKAIGAIVGVIKMILKLKDMLLSVLSKAVDAIGKIIKDPIGFLGNLLGAVKKGFMNFVANIGTHLKKGLMTWLFGELAKGGIQLPESFDLKGILTLVMQVLGLTWENLRARAVKLFGERVVGALEKAFEIFQIIKEKGLGGLWEYIKDKLSNLKEVVFDGIKDMIITQVIKAGVGWLMGLLGGPAGAFIKAAKAIYDIVMWFINNGSQVLSLIEAIISSISSIASGAIDAAASFIEQSLAKAIPVVIGFLASLLGLGGFAEKIKAIIKKVQEPISKAIDWVLDKAKAVAKKIGGMLGLGKGEKTEEKAEYTEQDRTEGKNAISLEEQKHAENGAMSKEGAQEVATNVQQKHPVFKSISVVDGKDSWDYKYVFRSEDKVDSSIPKASDDPSRHDTLIYQALGQLAQEEYRGPLKEEDFKETKEGSKESELQKIEKMAEGIHKQLASVQQQYGRACRATKYPENTFSFQGKSFFVDHTNYYIVPHDEAKGTPWTDQLRVANPDVLAKYAYGGDITKEQMQKIMNNLGNDFPVGGLRQTTLFLAAMVAEPSRHSVAHITNLLIMGNPELAAETKIFGEMSMTQGGSDPGEGRTPTFDPRVKSLEGKELTKAPPEKVSTRDLDAVKKRNPNMVKEIDEMRGSFGDAEIVSWIKAELRKQIQEV